MAMNQAHGRRVKAAAAVAGGVAVVAMGLIGVMDGGAPAASASSGAMNLGETTTSTTPVKDMPAKAVPVVKAARYGAS
ncbi:hypothetical protein JCM12141A_04030 [Mycolicibacterium hodleri]